MAAEPWLWVAVVVLAALHLSTVVVTFVGWDADRSTSSTGSAGQADENAAVDGDGVTCPRCGTENERGYRFCRACVAELPAHGRRDA